MSQRPFDAIASLRQQLDEANETIRQLRQSFATPAAARYRGLRAGRTERTILEALLATNGTVSRATLNRLVGISIGRIGDVGAKTIDVAIARLRPKLRQLDVPIFIGTAWGDGYYLTELHKQRLSDIRYNIEVEPS